ncbi:hypothetical protein R1flu_023301 [Riccia fluitans]|uniref:Galactokinase n=1 Tax=Riccia fluitans TaxID=41844 RepID=A0ABD1XS63_9MARC
MADVEEHIPVYSSLQEVYGKGEKLSKAQSRYQILKRKFFEYYGHIPELYARAPGRVNLIGEHIDYEGYSVLPMALLHDTIVAIRKQDPDNNPRTLRVVNISSHNFPGFVFPADPFQDVDRSKHIWANYLLCAYKGVFDHLRAKGVEIKPPYSGYDILVDGIVPMGAGVSSSSAIVCASAIAIMAVEGLNFSKREVAEFTCICERHIGTQSGGMDQAISIMAKKGVAKLIDFNPIRATDVVLPRKGAFVIANSLTVSTKAVSAASEYNYRVVECRLAAMVLAVKLGMALEEIQNVNTLSDIEGLCIAYADARGESSPLLAVEAHLHENPYTAHEIEDIIQVSLSDVFSKSRACLEVIDSAKSYHLLKRAKHVFSEAQRVYQFRDAVLSSDTDDEKLRRLGELMNESHTSCSKLYDCSCPELEELVKVCRANGAMGARLTGAGWGGCVVSLVEENSVPCFLESLKKDFFQSRIDSGGIKEGDLGTYAFASKPSGGAAILNL